MKIGEFLNKYCDNCPIEYHTPTCRQCEHYDTLRSYIHLPPDEEVELKERLKGMSKYRIQNIIDTIDEEGDVW